jgi:thiol-disulfide isomerase/thioredoxin
VTLSKLRGQVVVMNFWASWCTECHDEQDALDQTWQRYRDSGLVLLGVDFEDTSDGAKGLHAPVRADLPVVEDKDSKTALAVRHPRHTGDLPHRPVRADRRPHHRPGRRRPARRAVEPLLKGGSQ